MYFWKTFILLGFCLLASLHLLIYGFEEPDGETYIFDYDFDDLPSDFSPAPEGHLVDNMDDTSEDAAISILNKQTCEHPENCNPTLNPTGGRARRYSSDQKHNNTILCIIIGIEITLIFVLILCEISYKNSKQQAHIDLTPLRTAYRRKHKDQFLKPVEEKEENDEIVDGGMDEDPNSLEESTPTVYDRAEYERFDRMVQNWIKEPPSRKRARH